LRALGCDWLSRLDQPQQVNCAVSHFISSNVSLKKCAYTAKACRLGSRLGKFLPFSVQVYLSRNHATLLSMVAQQASTWQEALAVVETEVARVAMYGDMQKPHTTTNSLKK
jgi:hypothetical protein